MAVQPPPATRDVHHLLELRRGGLCWMQQKGADQWEQLHKKQVFTAMFFILTCIYTRFWLIATAGRQLNKWTHFLIQKPNELLGRYMLYENVLGFLVLGGGCKYHCQTNMDAITSGSCFTSSKPWFPPFPNEKNSQNLSGRPNHS